MPAHARRDIIPHGEICVVHVWSRCVQRAFLCGFDAYSGVDYSHRREPIRKLLEYQASVFAVDVGNYNILHNHKHAILRPRPDVAALWSDEEVAWRWRRAWPRWDGKQWSRTPSDKQIQELFADPERIGRARDNLGNVSWMMARWKEPLAKLFNGQSDRSGHFFEQRFGSRLLEDQAESICCSLYLDTNQTKAGAAPSLAESDFSAIQDRILAARVRESQFSFEALQGKPDFREHSLQAHDLEHLYADCWLSPISTDTPLSTPAKIIIPASYGPGSTLPSSVEDDQHKDEEHAGEIGSHPRREGEHTNAVSNRAVSNRAVSRTGDDRTASECESATPLQRPCEQDSPPVALVLDPTFEIHRRLQSSARRRASDQCFLPMPWPQYLSLAEWAAARLAPQAAATKAKQIEHTAAAATDTPATWRKAMLAFQGWLRSALGEAPGAIADAALACGFAPPPRGDPDP